ncbi:MAG TPA: hypothetical protein PK737_00615, partial [Bacilli bacterium]|nr:hypothetical protein [Bacilli bacterium]
EVWLSGINRKVLTAYYYQIKDQKQSYTLSDNPNKTDYIIKNEIIVKHNYNELEQFLKSFKDNIINFIKNV